MDGKRLILPDNPTLRDFQDYVAEMKKIRGFNVTDKFYECCLLAEETDVFIYVLSLANMHGLDLEEAFREKEEINKRREWKRL